jgi:hypothetical protein
MNDNGFGTIIQIGNCLISEDVVTEFFSCDYAVCKGKCCVCGDSGAPLAEDELEPLEKNYPFYKDLMTQAGRDSVSGNGFFTVDIDGDIVTPLCKDGSEACAYSFFDGDGNCFCSVERRFLQGKGDFRKPVSCWLYPIRITKLSDGKDALNVHHWDICRPAFEKGRKEGVRVYQFLREPLVSLYGEEFYSALSLAAKRLLADS